MDLPPSGYKPSRPPAAQLSPGRVDGISEEFGLGKTLTSSGDTPTQITHTHTCTLKFIFEAEAV